MQKISKEVNYIEYRLENPVSKCLGSFRIQSLDGNRSKYSTPKISTQGSPGALLRFSPLFGWIGCLLDDSVGLGSPGT